MGRKNKRLADRAEKALAGNYGRRETAMVEGRGNLVRDADGREYLDFVSGVAANALGHSPPELSRALSRQAKRLVHVSNHFLIEPQIELAEALVEKSFADKVFFCNSGAEANEAALKAARKYGNDVLGGRYEVIAAAGSFHGRTMATLSVTGQKKFHEGFQPLLPGVKLVPFGDLSAVRKAIGKKTCAVLVEPIQGEGGVVVPPDGYLADLRKLCDEEGILLVLDEIQVGMGRTGRLFAYEHEGIVPDVMTLAKALAGGFPIGAMCATDKVMSVLGPGAHGTTFGGNPLAMAAGLAAFGIISEEKFLARVRRSGEYLEQKLRAAMEKRPEDIEEVRGRGLLWAAVLRYEGGEVSKRAFRKGVLLNCTAGRAVRFMPSLRVTRPEIDRAVRVFTSSLGKKK